MRILNEVNYVGGLGADRWIGEGFKAAFEDLGHEFYWLELSHDLHARIAEVKPDIIMASQTMLTKENIQVFQTYRAQGMKLVMRVDSGFDRDPEIRAALVDGDPADLYYGEVENPHMDHFREKTGKEYHVIANGAHQRLHKPGALTSKYQCDIVFLGAMMPKKKEMFAQLLLPLKRKYDVRIYGPNWTVKDNMLRGLAKTARYAGFERLNRKINELRISVPIDEEPALYSSAKICVNVHERGVGMEHHVILNERTFKIPACGGFELCDYVPPLRNYFTENEMAMAEPRNGERWEDDWFEKIDYYIKHDGERETIRNNGIARALRDHTYLNRVRQLLELLGRRA